MATGDTATNEEWTRWDSLLFAALTLASLGWFIAFNLAGWFWWHR